MANTVIDWECYQRPDGSYMLSRTFKFPGCGHISTKFDILDPRDGDHPRLFQEIIERFSDPRKEVIMNQWGYQEPCSECGKKAPVSRHHIRGIPLPDLEGGVSHVVWQMVRERGQGTHRIDIRTLREIKHEEDSRETMLETGDGTKQRAFKNGMAWQDVVLAGLQASLPGHQEIVSRQ